MFEFQRMESCEFGQAWQSAPSKDFMPAAVRTSWNDETLNIYAEIHDADIYNSAARLNEMTHETGDVFEIFLGREDSPVYHEFHVTPENQKLQLKWPDAETIWKLKSGAEMNPFLIEQEVIFSRTWAYPEHFQWHVYAEIPMAVLGVVAPMEHVWKFSFSRYDYTRGKSDPIFSSTSPHKVCRFHRQEEWGRLIFQNP